MAAAPPHTENLTSKCYLFTAMKRDEYEPSPGTLTILMVLAVCVAVILMLLCSCKATREVEMVYTHDTLYVHHTDTFIHTKTLHVHDTTRQVEQHYITINQAGDTIKEIHHYHDTERTIIVDSTDRYKAKNDSLQRLLDRERNKEKTVEKEEPWWERWKWRLAFYAALCGLIIVLWRRSKGWVLKWLRKII